MRCRKPRDPCEFPETHKKKKKIALTWQSAVGVNAILTRPQMQVKRSAPSTKVPIGVGLQNWCIHDFGAMWCNLKPLKMDGLKSDRTESHVNWTGIRYQQIQPQSQYLMQKEVSKSPKCLSQDLQVTLVKVGVKVHAWTSKKIKKFKKRRVCIYLSWTACVPL